MSMDDRKLFIETNSKKRADIRSKLLDLEVQVKKYKDAVKTENTTETLDNVMIQTVKNQAKAKRFKVD